jgi:hypothetical protein
MIYGTRSSPPGQADPEPVFGLVKKTTGRIIGTADTNHVPFRIKNV